MFRLGAGLSGEVLILISAAGYACFSIFAKTAYDAAPQMGALDLLAWRFIIATPLIWTVIALRGQPAPEKPLPRLKLILLGALFTVVAGCALLTLERLPASTYTMLLYTYPALVALLSLLLGERLSLRGWVALTLTFVGVLLTVPDFREGLTDITGILFGIANASSYAIYIVVSGRVLRGHSDLTRASAWGITGSLLMIGAVSLVRGIVVPPNVTAWVGVAGLASLSGVIPIVLFYAGLRKLGASKAAILSTLEPVLTIVLAAMLLGERMQSIQILGGVCILASVILLQIRLPLKRQASISPEIVGAGHDLPVQ